MTQATVMMWLGAFMVVCGISQLFLPKQWFEWTPEGRFFLMIVLLVVGSSFIMGKGC